MIAYLHGFASGPGSTKARFFRERLAALGVPLAVPDLAPDFTHMTIDSMLAIVEPLVASGPAVLMGSSLGGYLAALVASRRPERVRALVLFAPAFGFIARWEESVGPKVMAKWRERKVLPVYHYGRGRQEPLSIALIDEAHAHPDLPVMRCPALIFAGRRDDAVPLASIETFAVAGPDRELVVHEAGHELTEVLEPMWDRTYAFLGNLGVVPSG